MPKDYYNTLGVDKSASKDEIKKAFRAKAHQFHPDKGGDEAKFKEVNEAYQVLGDETKRKQYDQYGQTFDGAGPGAGGFGGFGGQGMHFEDLGDIFGSMFGSGFGGGGGARAPRGGDALIDVQLTFNESIFGVEKEVSLSKNNACERCAGIGAEPGSSMKTCDTCKGQGYQVKIARTMLGNMQTRVNCEDCNGAGEIPETKCKDCDGDGFTYGKKTLRIDIPAGVEDGMRIRVRGEGESIGRGGESGDLFLQLHVKSDPRFQRDGKDIYVKKTIGFTQAALGDEVQVDTVDGLVKLKIPAGSQSGDRLRMKGKGVPEGSWRGDQYVVLKVQTPKKLSKAQKKLLEELDLREE